MDTLDAQTVADEFPLDNAGGAILGPIFDSNGGYYNVETNPVYAQYAYGSYGQMYWTPQVPIPVGPAILAPGTVGVRFKNYNAGQVAVVSGALSEHGEPSVQITSGGLSTPAVTRLNGITCVQTGTIPQATVSGVAATLLLDTVSAINDPTGIYSLNPATGVITLNAGGVFLCESVVFFAASGAGTARLALIATSGGEAARGFQLPGFDNASASGVAQLSAGGTISHQAFQNTGGGLNVIASRLTIAQLF